MFLFFILFYIKKEVKMAKAKTVKQIAIKIKSLKRQVSKLEKAKKKAAKKKKRR